MYIHTFSCSDGSSNGGYAIVLIASYRKESYEAKRNLDDHLRFHNREDLIPKMRYVDVEKLSAGRIYSNVEHRNI